MDEWMLLLVGGLTGAALAGVWAWSLLRGAAQAHRDLQSQHESLNAEHLALRQGAQQTLVELAQMEERAERTQSLEDQLRISREESTGLRESLSALKTELQAEKRQSQEKLTLLEESRAELTRQFKLLANEILEEKSRKFSEQNQERLGAILDPLKTRLGEFQAKVEQFYDNEGKQRSALSEQLRQLFSLNRALSEDAQNLTKALKGESKTRGNWGELVLERILQSLGLQAGREYEIQSSHTVDGNRLQPDVVIHLPDDRHIVVDSKVSLVDWEAACAADDESQRVAAMKRHLESLRGHIKGLSGKNYQDLYGIGSLDCVVMFVPIEPALLSVVATDEQLFQEAWRQNVLLVSASTLFFALRTVAYLWRQDDQSRNAQEIAKRGGELYDKFSGFVADFEKIGERLEQAQKSFEAGQLKLSTGKGNVIRRAEVLRELGVKPKKPLPQALVEVANESAGLAEVSSAAAPPAPELAAESGAEPD